MQERLADTQSTHRSGTMNENRRVVAGDGPVASRVKSETSTAKRVEAPARATDRGPFDIIFASAATIILWIVIVALVKWLS
jgi:hypothetical protein